MSIKSKQVNFSINGKKILKDISISIDLFQFGILLVDKKISKQHFIVKMR